MPQRYSRYWRIWVIPYHNPWKPGYLKIMHWPASTSSMISCAGSFDDESICSDMSAPPHSESDTDTLTSIDHAEQYHGTLELNTSGAYADAVLQDDGLLDITVHSTAQVPGSVPSSQLSTPDASPNTCACHTASLRRKPVSSPPRLNIVMQVVGSRGDVQPFIHLGQELHKRGHRVRLATHACFETFVRDHGLDFFSIGGDQNDLMSYMVRNPGLLPSIEAIKQGDVSRQRTQLHTMLSGCWQACFESQERGRPFVADTIIANPPAFAHVHCAEKLGIPLHVVFTMPWTPTKSFAHPLTRTRASGIGAGAANLTSYHMMDLVLAQGTRSPVNKLRRRTLDLEPIDVTYAAGLLDRLEVPITYLWPPCLVPKPADWGDHITVAGACTPAPAIRFDTPSTLVKFLEAGPPAVYIGFGSIVDSDSPALTNIILKATELAGIRAVVSRGWSQLGTSTEMPGHICLVDDIPHEWLFQNHIAGVVHHGGAGTTFAGLRAGLPSVIIPFFGDQYFWGDVVHKAGAGPAPIPRKDLSARNLAEAIIAALSGSCRTAAASLAAKLKTEDGAANFATAFHASLPLSAMRCSLDPSRAAVWQLSSRSKWGVRLSTFAASVLLKERCIGITKLVRYRVTEYNAVNGPREPFAGSTLAVTKDIYGVFKGFGEIGAGIDRNIP
nr:hypothetical protein B0A51_17764 [Rachicladosporium sp. CCFEE 5018]